MFSSLVHVAVWYYYVKYVFGDLRSCLNFGCSEPMNECDSFFLSLMIMCKNIVFNRIKEWEKIIN